MQSILLAEHSPKDFLTAYWQKKPLLIRQGIASFTSPLTPNELAGLACEPDVQSRLILEQGGTHPWELREGPFEPEVFVELPESHWTLLVQEVDRLIPEVNELLDYVRFLPRWRIDDIMVSYAPKHGTVGAHVDNYDVFLLQGYGDRRWDISSEPLPPEDESLIEGLDVRILSDFEADESWILEPGDVLYLPPRVPHYGVAVDDCMTYSIGFRAPTHREMVFGFMEYAADAVDGQARFSDPDITPRANPGRITNEDLTRVYTILEQLVGDRERMKRWFGQVVTRPSRGGESMPPDTQIDGGRLAERITRGGILRRSEASRFSCVEEPSGSSLLFVSGTTHEIPPPWAALADLLCSQRQFSSDALAPFLRFDDCAALLALLYNGGHLYFVG